jgi:hypothetical protein
MNGAHMDLSLESTRLSRRAFVGRALVAAGALVALPGALAKAGLAQDDAAAALDLVTDTFNGLVAFVVPGADAYSVAQGESTALPGGIDAFATQALIEGLAFAQPSQPLASIVASLLNMVAQGVDPTSATGPFASPFANLPFAEKAAVLDVLEHDEAFAQLWSLVGLLPSLVAFLAYSEVGAFDPATRTLVRRPIGWTLTSYDGVADGRDAFVGYFENRRKVDA